MFTIFVANNGSLIMSPRNKRLRKVLNPPVIKGFKPYGKESENKGDTIVNIHVEEYEAIRLCDYDGYTHHQASEIMGISRPTFTRVYALARQKVAKAFVEGCQISIEGGKVYFDSDWYHCRNCSCYFNNPDKSIPLEICPLCGSCLIENYAVDDTTLQDVETSCSSDVCLCPVCGHEQRHARGRPCNQEVCEHCQSRMTRKAVHGGRRNKGRVL